MARALIVGCGCRGRELGRVLIARGWQVRGTTRDEATLREIEAAGLEGAIADPDRIATVTDQLDGVALVYWLLGSASGGTEALEDLHGPRLERLLSEIVDTPVRGFVYELPIALGERAAGRAFEILRRAGESWRIPFEVVDAAPDDHESWLRGMVDAAEALTAPRA